METEKIRNYNDDELKRQEQQTAEQLFRLRFQMKLGQNEGVKKLRELKKDVARINTISPGIIFTSLARDELSGPRGAGYRRMIELCPAGRGGTPDEVGAVGALLMGPEGTFLTGSDFLMDGGVTASYRERP